MQSRNPYLFAGRKLDSVRVSLLVVSLSEVVESTWLVCARQTSHTATPAQSVCGNQITDAHLGLIPGKDIALAVDVRNLLQPRPLESSGDNSNPIGIRREVYAALQYNW